MSIEMDLALTPVAPLAASRLVPEQYKMQENNTKARHGCDGLEAGRRWRGATKSFKL